MPIELVCGETQIIYCRRYFIQNIQDLIYSRLITLDILHT